MTQLAARPFRHWLLSAGGAVLVTAGMIAAPAAANAADQDWSLTFGGIRTVTTTQVTFDLAVANHSGQTLGGLSVTESTGSGIADCPVYIVDAGAATTCVVTRSFTRDDIRDGVLELGLHARGYTFPQENLVESDTSIRIPVEPAAIPVSTPPKVPSNTPAPIPQATPTYQPVPNPVRTPIPAPQAIPTYQPVPDVVRTPTPLPSAVPSHLPTLAIVSAPIPQPQATPTYQPRPAVVSVPVPQPQSTPTSQIPVAVQTVPALPIATPPDAAPAITPPTSTAATVSDVPDGASLTTPAATGAPILAHTGGTIAWGAAVAGVVVAIVGAVLVLLARRRAIR